jgi:hypothetical protein
MYYIEESNVPSYDNYRTYKIRKGDTLQSVANELGVDAQELRRYHNMRCNIPDLIEADFKSYLELLILAPEKSKVATVSEEKIPKKVIFGSQPFTIPFYPVNINNSYNVKYSIDKGDTIKKIEFDVSVKWLRSDKNGICFFEIDRLSKVLIDEKVIETKVDALAEMTASILYPMQVVVDQNGNWIDIFNYQTIRERWEDEKIKVLDYYEGKHVLKYIDAVEYTLRDEESLMESLSDDWFLSVFFNGIHTCYGSDLVVEKDTHFSIIPKRAIVNTNVEQKIEEYLDEANLIVIKQKGEFTDEDLKEKFLRNNEVAGYYSAEYSLNPNHYSIEKITLECTLNLDSPKKVNIEIRNLNDKKEVVIASRQSIFIAEEKKKDGFFKGLFKR